MRSALEIFDCLLHCLDWAVLSAERAECTRAENDAATSVLADVLQVSGREYHPVRGIYDGTSENSFLILGIAPEDAVALGAAFCQESVLTARGLEYCDGSGYLPTDGIALATDPRNSSTVYAPDGYRVPFVSAIRRDSERVVA